jgi:septum site-determining protein MinD
LSQGKIVSVHSFRGGTGKSNFTANLAAALMGLGKRVAVLDTDIQSPGVHLLFGLEQREIQLTLVDFLWGKCTISETAYDVTQRLQPSSAGKCWLVPASLTTRAITRILDEGYEVDRLNSHFDELLEDFQLDYLLIDTHPGLNRETMLSTALSDILIIIVRPDRQDYFGTAVLSEIAHKLEVPNIFLVLNKVFSQLDQQGFRKQIEKALGFEVIGVMPLSEDLARLESTALIIRQLPNHPISHTIRDVATRLDTLEQG